MKTLSTFLLAATILPKVLSAQPTITTNEYYDVGQVVNMTYVDASTVHAGASGANVVWDYTGLATNGGNAVTTATANTSGSFGTSNLIITRPNGDIQYMSENSSDSYVNVMIDHATHDTITYNFYDIAKRPFTYMGYFLDTYKIRSNSPITTGNGSLEITSDAWGTLKLPTGVFTNVLRIKKLQSEIDTVSGATISFSKVTYQWFDAAHKAPLLQLDSMVSAAGNNNTAMYLASTVGVPMVNANSLVFTAYIGNSDVLLTGSFENGSTYDVAIYSMIGTRIYTGNFTAGGNRQQIEIGRDLAPGIYIISITERSISPSTDVIKVVKQ